MVVTTAEVHSFGAGSTEVVEGLLAALVNCSAEFSRPVHREEPPAVVDQQATAGPIVAVEDEDDHLADGNNNNQGGGAKRRRSSRLQVRASQ